LSGSHRKASGSAGGYLLDEQRVNGSVIPLQDLIKDACDNVVHFSDYKA
jgi:hypothetical protein